MENNNPIYQWLSTVEDHEQSGHQDGAENQEQVKDTTLTTSIPRIRMPLEISDSVRGNGHSASRKRNSGHLEKTKASSAHETIPGNECHKRSLHSYELRPRHKTREDCYEYKGPSSAVDTHRKGRAKTARGRRHTMNDDFHAINVTGNRLTLRSNTNLGIFSKGRSSSTTNHHGNTPSTALTKPAPSAKFYKHAAESDLAFSEMRFLSRRNNFSPYPPSTARDTLDGQYEREYHPQEQQFDDPAHHSTFDTSQLNRMLRDVDGQLDSSVTPRFTCEEAPVSEISPTSSHSRGGFPESPNKRRKTLKRPSSVPYTWTETEADNTKQSHALEQHLLNLLRVGIYPQALRSEVTNTVLARRYWSLAELWALLEERKVSWSNKAGNKERGSPEANTGQLAAVEAEAAAQEVPEVITPDDLDLVNVGTLQNEMSKQSPGSNVACETSCIVNNGLPQQPSVLEQQQGGPCQASDKAGSLNPQPASISSQNRFIGILNEDQCEPLPHESTEDEVLFPPSVPEVEQPHMSDIEFYELDRFDDDDVFYRTLDAAYCAIVHPRVAAEVASDLQQLLESPELNGTDLPNTPESTGIRDSDIPTLQVEARESEHLAAVSQDIIQEGFDERPTEPSCQQKFPTSHSDDLCVDQNNDLPWLTTGYGQSQPRGSTGFDARQSQPPGLSDFWRRNKLY
ncbi:hypothetical protein N7517_004565 [Penicillium concentricum]|uniref:Uncharacterized protein n=1 Tax=Penicillium concentricum TaxID=293559 RepID=A0A9W9S8G2_9EURO|nr:uncharacterized protein N7517_004565 [Penicillium concentricum]KAJ5372559.1 hypothetical protein N7517_004565 [Penicillium concentricum]